MPLIRGKLIESFIELMSNLNLEIDEHGKVHLSNIHTVAEIFYMQLLNRIYGWKLVNANKIKKNYPGIDLIDAENMIVVQVTADYTSSKINKTMNQDVIKELAEEGFKLKFCFIGKENSKHKKLSAFTNPYNIDYTPSEDDITLNDIINAFSMIEELSVQSSIYAFVEEETGRKFKLTDDISNKNLEFSTKQLQARYTPEANVETDINKSLDCFVNKKDFIDFSNSLKISANKTLERLDSFECDTEETRSIIELGNKFAKEIVSFLSSTSNFDVNIFQTEYEMRNSLYDLQRNNSNKPIELVKLLQGLQEEFDEYNEHYNLNVLGKKTLIISGKAGMGKSHSLADFVNKLNRDEYLPLLFLGQKIMSYESPIQQLIKQLGVECTENEFLDAIIKYCSLYNKKVVIGIDAINEGIGKKYWKDNLLELIEKLQLDNVYLIITIRTDYRNIIMGDSGILTDDKVVEIEHYGFEGIEYEAIDEYCKYYQLNKPIFPFIDNIYKSPLLLKLTCEALVGNGMKDFPKKFTYEFIMDNYVKHINKLLAKELDHSSINLVDKSLLAIVSHSNYKYSSLSYEDCQVTIRSVIKQFESDQLANCYLDKLIESNILNFAPYSDDKVCFAYEILGDYYEAKCIVELYTSKNLLENEEAKEKIQKIVSDQVAINHNWGCIGILSSLLPNKSTTELYSFCDDEEVKMELGSHFIDSLLWRDSFDVEKNKDFINDILSFDTNLWRAFIYNFVRIVILDYCSLDANKLNELLCKMPLDVYEYIWTQELAYDGDLIKIIDWIWENAQAIERSSLYNYAILLTWLTASTNSSVRDHATKGLVNILIRCPAMIPKILISFINCKDIYVLERLFAGIYGTFVHTTDDTSWQEICDKIYEFVFCGTETLPNIYVRKYTRLVLEKYCLINGFETKVKYPSVYKTHSKWYDFVPTNEDIDNLINDVKTKYGDDSKEYYMSMQIMHSMTTEYGRGTGGYGDFGRYTFGYEVAMWKNQYFDQSLSNIITYNILNVLYNFELFTQFDNQCNGYLSRTEKIERIGKKYQWIGMHELLARLLDNIVPTKKNRIYSDEQEDVELFDIDDSVLTFKRRKEIGTTEEIIQNPELTVYERISDIDPTYIWYDHNILNSYDVSTWINDINKFDCAPEVYNRIVDQARIININDKKYVNIYTQVDLKLNADQPRRDRKNFYWMSTGCLVCKKDYDYFMEKRRSINNNGIPYERQMNSYLYGFYDSFIYRNILKQIEEDKYDLDPNYISLIENYFWEAANDYSLRDNSSVEIPMPSKEIIDSFNLTMKNIADWKNKDGENIVFLNESQGIKSVYLGVEELKFMLKIFDAIFVTGEYMELEDGTHVQRIWQNCEFNNEVTEFKTIIDEYDSFDADSSIFDI